MLTEKISGVGLMGGTFDPVHIGHLRVAIEFAEAFGLTDVRLVPSHKPVHRGYPLASSLHRHEMLELAVASSALLSVDDVEIKLESNSYTIDTLKHLREYIGCDIPLYFAMGVDAFNTIEYWKDWSDLFDQANFVVLTRPSVELDITNPEIERRFQVFHGERPPCGAIYQLNVSALDISSTQIRNLLANRKSIDYLVPDSVNHYIQTNRLYS